MTAAQRRVYDAIEAFQMETGFAPSYEQIGLLCNYSSLATVAKHIENLEFIGALTRKWNSGHSIKLKREFSNRKCTCRCHRLEVSQ